MKQLIEMSVFEGGDTHTLVFVNLDLTIGRSSCSLISCHDAQTVYRLLLGIPGSTDTKLFPPHINSAWKAFEKVDESTSTQQNYHFKRWSSLFWGLVLFDEFVKEGVVAITNPRGAPLPAFEDLEADQNNSARHPRPSKQSRLDKKKRVWQEDNSLEKIHLADGRMDDVLWLSTGRVLLQDLGPLTFLLLQVKKLTMMEVKLSLNSCKTNQKARLKNWLKWIHWPGEESRPIFISANLSAEMKQAILDLLWEFKDVFAWIYTQMPGPDPQLVMHNLNIREWCSRQDKRRGISD